MTPFDASEVAKLLAERSGFVLAIEKIRARHGRRRDEFCAINTGA